jgi:hypothetical protein
VISGYTDRRGPVECGGRLYWLERAPGSGGSMGEPATVVSAALDCSDRKIVLDRTAEGVPGVEYLLSDGRALYAVATLPRGHSRRDGGVQRWFFGRVRPEEMEPLRPHCRIPSGISQPRLEGEYAYFTVSERKESGLAWWHPPRLEWATYRCRLPK